LGRIKSVEAFTDYNWKNLKIASIDERLMSSSVYLDMGRGDDIKMVGLPKDEAQKICAIAQKMKEEALNESSNTQTPIAKLLKCLKELLDEEVITQAEYDAKKADLLSRM
jgi:hypothetical protein